MPKFSNASHTKLATCAQELQLICDELIKEIDFVVLCGNRGEEEQNLAFASGRSKAKFPDSKHNTYPSKAVDLAPYPIDWNDTARFKDLAVRFKRIAKEKNIPINWGGDFKKLVDMPHFELV